MNIKLYDHQYRYHSSTASVRCFIGGRGSGKTVAGAVDLVIRACQTPAKYLAIAPTYRVLTDVVVPEIVKVYPSATVKTSDMSITIGSSTVLLRSCDNPDRLRGLGVAGAWWDEAREGSKEVYDIVLGCLRWEGGMGWLGITTTPIGGGWLQSVVRQESTFLVRASSQNNPFLSLDFVARLRLSYPSNWQKQEIEGEFLTSLKIFDVQKIGKISSLSDKPLISGRAWDLACSHGRGDWTVGCRLDFRKAYTISDIVRERQPAQRVSELIQLIAGRDGESCYIGLETVGASDRIAIEAWKRVLPQYNVRECLANSSTGSKLQRALPVAAAIERGEVQVLERDWTGCLLGELDEFSGSDDGVDDQVDALAHAYNLIAPMCPPIQRDESSVDNLSQMRESVVREQEIEKLLASMSEEERRQAEEMIRANTTATIIPTT